MTEHPDHDPFHDGERAIQELTGERAAAVMNGGVISDRIPAAATGFVAAQDMIVVVREDAGGALRPVILSGPQGFAQVSDDRGSLGLSLIHAGPLPPDGPLDDLEVGDRIGGLFIELTTRRRLRVNGTVARRSADQIDVRIAEAYPACPKYIQKRIREESPGRPDAIAVVTGSSLDVGHVAWIEAADTLFVASRGPDGQLDVSHRGGAPGFVRVENGVLVVPDFPGNSMFNTLGNLTLDPRAGLVVPDFAAGRQLAMSGTVELDLARRPGASDDPTGGTGRWWRFTPDRWTVTTTAPSPAWSAPVPSPFNPASIGSGGAS